MKSTLPYLVDIRMFDFSFPLSLPKAVKRRINALKQLQVRCAHIEAKFYEEVHDLERKYAALYQPLFDKVGSSLIRCVCRGRAFFRGDLHAYGVGDP